MPITVREYTCKIAIPEYAADSLSDSDLDKAFYWMDRMSHDAAIDYLIKGAIQAAFDEDGRYTQVAPLIEVKLLSR